MAGPRQEPVGMISVAGGPTFGQPTKELGGQFRIKQKGRQFLEVCLLQQQVGELRAGSAGVGKGMSPLREMHTLRLGRREGRNLGTGPAGLGV